MINNISGIHNVNFNSSNESSVVKNSNPIVPPKDLSNKEIPMDEKVDYVERMQNLQTYIPGLIDENLEVKEEDMNNIVSGVNNTILDINVAQIVSINGALLSILKDVLANFFDSIKDNEKLGSEMLKEQTRLMQAINNINSLLVEVQKYMQHNAEEAQKAQVEKAAMWGILAAIGEMLLGALVIVIGVATANPALIAGGIYMIVDGATRAVGNWEMLEQAKTGLKNVDFDNSKLGGLFVALFGKDAGSIIGRVFAVLSTLSSFGMSAYNLAIQKALSILVSMINSLAQMVGQGINLFSDANGNSGRAGAMMTSGGVLGAILAAIMVPTVTDEEAMAIATMCVTVSNLAASIGLGVWMKKELDASTFKWDSSQELKMLDNPMFKATHLIQQANQAYSMGQGAGNIVSTIANLILKYRKVIAEETKSQVSGVNYKESTFKELKDQMVKLMDDMMKTVSDLSNHNMSIRTEIVNKSEHALLA